MKDKNIQFKIRCDGTYIFQKRMIQKYENVHRYIHNSRTYNDNILYIKSKGDIDMK